MQGRFFFLSQKMLKLAILLAAGVGAIWYLSTLQFIGGDLHNNLWGPARLLVHGQSPYDTRVLQQPADIPWLPPVWLPMAIGLFFPLGWLTVYQASQLWLIGSISILIVTIWLVGGGPRPPIVPFALSGLAAFMFPPTLSHLGLGQFTVLSTLALLLSARFVTRPRYLLAGFLVAVALAKPQLGALVVPGLFVAYGRLYRLGGVLSFVGALVLWIVLLIVPLWIAHPAWFSDFVTALRQNQEWAQPSLFTLLRLQWGTAGWLLWGLLAAGLFGANAWLWLKYPPENAVIWSLALTPLVTPYIWSWDFAILVPLMTYAFFHLEFKPARLLFGLGYVSCWCLMVWVRFNTDNSDHRFWWIPWLIVAGACAAYLIDARLSAHPRLPTQSQQERSIL